MATYQSVTMATAHAVHHSYLLNSLAQPLLAFSTSLTEIITKMGVGIKRRLNNVTVPGYDNLILKFSANFVGKVG